MSKLEREIDELAGERTVEVQWPLSEATLREYTWRQLKSEVDQHQFRVPLDLRKVQGAPSTLIELLHDLNDYAESVGKHIIISHALPEMRLALTPATQTPGKGGARDGKTAGDAAWEVLRDNLARGLAAVTTPASEPAPDGASGRATATKRRRSVGRRTRRWQQFALAILLGTLFAGALEWAVLVYFQQSHSQPVIVHERDFEDR